MTFLHHTNHTAAAAAVCAISTGPRCFTMLEGKRREALDALMDLSDVVLMTEDEARTVTGSDDPDVAARCGKSKVHGRCMEWNG
jgi:sugar/nucleoside kinase (ribokinase family)